jgi:heme-degrading monooxygenase HmoA
MSSREVAILARVVVQPNKVEDVDRVFKEMQSARPGLISQTLWRSTSYPERCAVLTHYEDEASAEADFEEMVESGLIERATNAMGGTPDIKHFHIVDTVPGQVDGFDMKGVMSLSIQVAPPGGLDERLAELLDMAQSFEVLEGFRGFKLCRGVQVCDEVLSLMFWDSVPAFRASMPRQPLNPVEVFGRVA